MLSSDDSLRKRAQILFQEHRDAIDFSPFADGDAVATIDDAYAIQDFYVGQLVESTGEPVCGYKIGLTSPRMQALLQIESPIAGAVLKHRILQSGLEISRSDYGRLGCECEIAVRMGRDLTPSSAPYEFDTVAAAVEAVAPAFEVVDDRNADFAITDIGSLVADNSWNAGVVLGPWSSQWPDLNSLEGVLRVNGSEIDRGRAEDVLGHPFNALTWLANHLAGGERGLRRGDIVATGSMIPTRLVAEAESLAFEIDGLGRVAMDIIE